jgi:hypothetical protein
MTNDIAARTLIESWRKTAKAKRARANELGDCRAGLEFFTEAAMLTTCADEAERALLSQDPVIPLSRPGSAAHLPVPDEDAALSTAGVLFHYIGGSAELRERLARWLEHHEGDLDDETVLWYLTACHALLEPDCDLPIGWDPHPGRQR